MPEENKSGKNWVLGGSGAVIDASKKKKHFKM